jgi:hypothetical protein
MKALYIIESETPGITRSRVEVPMMLSTLSPDLEIEIGDFSAVKLHVSTGYYKGHRVLKSYRSGWGYNTYFIRHFM